MRVHSSTRYAAIAALVGALACASNKARVEPDQAAAARDTTTSDTTGGQAQNPPGYRGMERDTTIAPPSQQTPGDTFLQNQGQGQPQDTAGYSGVERVDTTGQTNPSDTTGAAAGVPDTAQAWGADTSAAGRSEIDSTGMSRTGDTTGYSPSQQPQDTGSVR
jgi:hypothetical protein